MRARLYAASVGSGRRRQVSFLAVVLRVLATGELGRLEHGEPSCTPAETNGADRAIDPIALLGSRIGAQRDPPRQTARALRSACTATAARTLSPIRLMAAFITQCVPRRSISCSKASMLRHKDTGRRLHPSWSCIGPIGGPTRDRPLRAGRSKVRSGQESPAAYAGLWPT